MTTHLAPIPGSHNPKRRLRVLHHPSSTSIIFQENLEGANLGPTEESMSKIREQVVIEDKPEPPMIT